MADIYPGMHAPHRRIEMFDYSKVDEVVHRIVDATHPRMITIFGSVSRCEARDDSDLDILVVFDEVENEKALYAAIARQFVGLRLPFDLVIASYEDYLYYKERRYPFIHEIATTGAIVYSEESFRSHR